MKRVSEETFQENLVSVFGAKQSKTEEPEDPLVAEIKTARAEAKKKLDEAAAALCPPPPILKEDIREAGPQIVAEIERICKENPKKVVTIELFDTELTPMCTTFKCKWWIKVVTWSENVWIAFDKHGEDDLITARAQEFYWEYVDYCQLVIKEAWYHVHPSLPISFGNRIMEIEIDNKRRK